MNTFRLILRSVVLLLLCLGVALSCVGQTSPTTVQTLLILPFENRSKSPGLEWIGESFTEILSQRLASTSLYVISRDDRLHAFDRLGIPSNIRPSRATLYKIAEEMDSDYVVMGDFNFDGQKFVANARVLDMKHLKESSVLESSGPLASLIDIQTALAWNLLKTIQPQSTISHDEFVRSANPVRLDAFESYVRGILANTRQEKVKRFREAIRLNPQYTLAMLQLGKTYYVNHEYDSAANWLSRIPQSDPRTGEAHFLLGLACYYQGQLDRAEDAFNVTAARLPLTEVYNNMGAVALRRGKKTAVQFFQRAVNTDPNDPDYRFNLALALYRSGDSARAMKNLRESLSRYPTDIEARQLMDEISAAPATAPAGTNDTLVPTTSSLPPWQSRLALPRLKRNYDENSFRLLALEIQNSAKPPADATANKSTSFHVQHGMELLDRGLNADAESEFRQALMSEPGNAAAHVGLARAAESKGDFVTARQEALTAIRLRRSAAAYLVLAHVDLKQKQLRSAAQNVDHALSLEPANADALTMKQEIAAREAQALDSPR